MALFGKKKESTKESAEVTVKNTAPKALASDRNLASVIVRPRVTEKSVGQSEQNVYTFEVKRSANKFEVSKAIQALYKVTPVKINIVNKRPAQRLVGSRNRMKQVSGMKKAYVYLKKGDSINLV